MNTKFKQVRRKPVSAGVFRFFINLWPPFLGAGIKIAKMTPDYREITVVLKQHWYNTNYVGTHFGGSMYMMSDAFYMLILLHNLGTNYIVWDQAANIQFKKPGRGTLTANFSFTDEELQSIRDQADRNDKYVFDKPVNITNKDNEIVATVIKTLYVRNKAKIKTKENDHAKTQRNKEKENSQQ